MSQGKRAAHEVTMKAGSWDIPTRTDEHDDLVDVLVALRQVFPPPSPHSAQPRANPIEQMAEEAWRRRDTERAYATYAPIAELQAGSRRAADALKADSATQRQDQRRAIDALLREDARLSPAFSVARRAAVLTAAESMPTLSPADAKAVFIACRVYEERRGGMGTARREATEFASTWPAGPMRAALGAYERARGCR